ncbi:MULTISPECIES: cytochrome b [Ralstonia solanacearum species complex]|uniref:Putative cytochrome b561 cytochrome transmembrane protein n=1 Tax=Ralstonia solanacearum TaxID=305 RepID=A0A0S4VZK6_RALSL|nr:cytochrome b [Ralstonia pseudosolanacearum]CUV22103.1 putative cytochrome b561 cytochrome transmembrane protein [Ralstonia solanacearum]CUV35324.1 putative cytochrome b561 cytochrome transmembrane protein [Ralstonia solanacearum]CUV39545.1 putative cytochrome b561 cytochrome transmembrane protein [Ralstonia solanacearum]CUV60298.1 putative cytochrome b561 cytochrome transmembrane protein [Ralstonia solanacearum]
MRFEPKYSLGMRALHWLVFLAALIAVVTIEILDAFPKGSAARAALFAAHQTMGLSVLALMVLRMLVRVGGQVPAPASGSQLLERAARLTHGVLYVLMVGMPILGVLAIAWSGKPIQPFGLALTLTLAQDKTLANLAKEVHESGATLVYIFVGLHAAAALWHEFILKDRLLRRMI